MKHLKHIYETDDWATSNRLGDIPIQNNKVEEFTSEYKKLCMHWALGGARSHFQRDIERLARRLAIQRDDIRNILQLAENNELPFGDILYRALINMR